MPKIGILFKQKKTHFLKITAVFVQNQEEKEQILAIIRQFLQDMTIPNKL
jgi:hypothetical protein